ncbi:MAG: complex I NDUFA9 subunit family protein [Parasphingorhabdus sp.]
MKLDGKLVCIFGGGGFLGRYISQRLLSLGARVRIAERSVKNAVHIKPLGNLGQTQLASADVTKKESVERAVHGCDTVINLVGVFGSDMEKVNVEGARNVAEAAASSGCASLIQMSAIGADPESPSLYGRSKAGGEKAAQDAFPGTIILRPSIVFGREDEFINRFAGMIQMLPIVPVIGSDTKFQPVFVGDVADAVTNILASAAEHAGKTFELGGPEVMSMGDLNRRIAKLASRERDFVDVPDLAAKILAMLPGSPISTDQYKMLAVDNIVANKTEGLDDLGVSPTSLAAVAPGWLEQFAEQGRFGARAKAA